MLRKIYFIASVASFMCIYCPLIVNAASTINKVKINQNIQQGLQFEAVRLQDKNPAQFTLEVKITPKSVIMPRISDTSLSLVEISQHTSSIRGLRKIACTKQTESLLCRFTIPKTSLNNSNLCFVYTVRITSIQNGKVIQQHNADFYYFPINKVPQKQL